MPDTERAVLEAFSTRYGRAPSIVGIAPGRVELLGNHTDHNRGLVMSAAIDRYTCVALSRNDSSRVRLFSANTASSDEFGLSDISPLPRGSWSNYVRGAVAGLVDAGVLVAGFDAAIAGDLPLGGGLSSSASLECAMAAAIVALFDSQTGRPVPSGMSLAQLLQQSEQRMVGVQCGILDQFSSMFGRRGHALFLDCDSLAHDAVPFGADPPAIVVCDSRLPRELATGKYNQRRTECEAALAAICRLRGGSWPSLSHVPDRDFELCEEAIPDPLARRARHVLNENRRVRAGLALLKGSGDVRGFGRLMIESHASSRDDFENSLPELDALIEIAIGLPGCWGAKVSGAGWGGCTVNLVDRTHADAFGAGLASKYAARFGNSPRILTCQSAGGAHAVRHDPAES